MLSSSVFDILLMPDHPPRSINLASCTCGPKIVACNLVDTTQPTCPFQRRHGRSLDVLQTHSGRSPHSLHGPRAWRPQNRRVQMHNSQIQRCNRNWPRVTQLNDKILYFCGIELQRMSMFSMRQHRTKARYSGRKGVPGQPSGLV